MENSANVQFVGDLYTVATPQSVMRIQRGRLASWYVIQKLGFCAYTYLCIDAVVSIYHAPPPPTFGVGWGITWKRHHCHVLVCCRGVKAFDTFKIEVCK